MNEKKSLNRLIIIVNPSLKNTSHLIIYYICFIILKKKKIKKFQIGINLNFIHFEMFCVLIIER